VNRGGHQERNRSSMHSVYFDLDGQRLAPRANQIDRPVRFFCAPEEATRANQFPFLIQLSFFHGTEVGNKSESIRNTAGFLSWGRGGHQERINS
jgi:hypothetical protein